MHVCVCACVHVCMCVCIKACTRGAGADDEGCGVGGMCSADLAQVVIGQRNRLLEYFFARRGTGKPQCPVGRGEYEKFFLQTPIFTSGTSDCPLMLGPGLRCVTHVPSHPPPRAPCLLAAARMRCAMVREARGPIGAPMGPTALAPTVIHAHSHTCTHAHSHTFTHSQIHTFTHWAGSFAKRQWGADFMAQDGFLLTKVDTCVEKDKATSNLVHAYGVPLPRT